MRMPPKLHAAIPWVIFVIAILSHAVSIQGDMGLTVSFFLGGSIAGLGMVQSITQKSYAPAVCNGALLLADVAILHSLGR